MGRPSQPTAVEVTYIAGGVLEVSWRPPLWDGGFPLDHYILTLCRWDGSQQRWQPMQLAADATEVAVPSAAAATGGGDGGGDGGEGGEGGEGDTAAADAVERYRLGDLAPAEYRAELRAVNTQASCPQ